jgi:hypothetical protein
MTKSKKKKKKIKITKVLLGDTNGVSWKRMHFLDLEIVFLEYIFRTEIARFKCTFYQGNEIS